MYDRHGLFLALFQDLPIHVISSDSISYQADKKIKKSVGAKDYHFLEIIFQDDGYTVLWLTSFEGEVFGREEHKSTDMTLRMLFNFVRRSYGLPLLDMPSSWVLQVWAYLVKPR